MRVINDRNALILSRVRQGLKQFNQNRLEDDEIYDLANQVQDDIFGTCDIPKEFKIILKKGQTDYDFTDESALSILKVTPSWSGTLERVKFIEWDNYKDIQTGLPVYYTILGQTLKISKPMLDNLFISFAGYQLKTIVPMDDEIIPEIPTVFDNALVYGILAKLTADAEAMYITLRDKASSRFNNPNKNLIPNECSW